MGMECKYFKLIKSPKDIAERLFLYYSYKEDHLKKLLAELLDKYKTQINNNDIYSLIESIKYDEKISYQEEDFVINWLMYNLEDDFIEGLGNKIPEQLFADTDYVEWIRLPQQVDTIYDMAFADAEIDDIIIDNPKIKKLGDKVFRLANSNCNIHMKKITRDKFVEDYLSQDFYIDDTYEEALGRDEYDPIQVIFDDDNNSSVWITYPWNDAKL